MKLQSARPYRSQHLFLIGLGIPIWSGCALYTLAVHSLLDVRDPMPLAMSLIAVPALILFVASGGVTAQPASMRVRLNGQLRRRAVTRWQLIGWGVRAFLLLGTAEALLYGVALWCERWLTEFGVLVAVLCGSALLLHVIPAEVWSWCDRALAGDRPAKPVDRCRWVSFSTGDRPLHPVGDAVGLEGEAEEEKDVPDWIAPPFRLP